MTRAVLPSLLLKRYGPKTYVIMGAAECLRGLLAFFACPLFGVLSDSYGRRPCLLITVLGTLAPVCSLAFLPAFDDSAAQSVEATRLSGEGNVLVDGFDTGDAAEGSYTSSFWLGTMPFSFEAPAVHRIDVFVVLFALSGVFSSTFTLTFAYIADVVSDQKDRVAAFGLALATFGLSFTIGPLLGGYLSSSGYGQGGRTMMKMLHLDDEDEINTSATRRTDSETTSHLDISPIGQHRVFVTVLILAVVDLFYIHFILPESRKSQRILVDDGEGEETTDVVARSSTANAILPGGSGVSRRASPKFWNPVQSIKYLTTHPLLRTVGRVTLLYYTALHAVVSTLVLYAARQFHLGPQQLGELMAALGLSTMVSEALLVRVAIPLFGENQCIKYGLTSFFLQCVVLAIANRPWQLYACAVLAMVGNLVYPSVSSLVSESVEPDQVGKALGAVNGVKALTEGIGPLIFGSLLTVSEKSSLPGWPYLVAALLVAISYTAARDLPEEDDCEILHRSETEVVSLTNDCETGDDNR